jgi:hypothetical protein
MIDCMTHQEYIVDATKSAAKEFFRYAMAVPSDKLTWTPLPGGRTVLSLCQEIAMTPLWAKDTAEMKPHEFGEEEMEKVQKVMDQWTSIDQCLEVFEKNMEDFAAFVLALPDGDLGKTRWLPYEGGREFNMVEMLDYPRWNLNYHTGQLAYIQTLFGDKEMH